MVSWQRSLWRECVAAFPSRLDVSIFAFTQCVGVTHLVSGFSSAEIALWRRGTHHCGREAQEYGLLETPPGFSRATLDYQNFVELFEYHQRGKSCNGGKLNPFEDVLTLSNNQKLRFSSTYENHYMSQIIICN